MRIALHVQVIGGLFIVLALAHGAFPRYFRWRRELAHLGLLERQVMYVHTFFVALVVGLMGLLCLLLSHELLHTRLGYWLCWGLAAFWLIRLYAQFFVYSAQLWRGKRFETRVHIAFALFWAYVSVVFVLAVWHHPAG